jgi:hypothetical protein
MINFVTKKEEFEKYKSKYLEIFKNNRKFEENIFQNSFKYFIGFEFDYIFHKSFFKNLKSFILDLNEDHIIFYTIDPSPEIFFNEFNKYNVLNISIQNTDKELTEIFMNNSVDELAMYSNDIVWFSNSDEWAIAASRDWEIAIVGFISKDMKNRFLNAFKENSDMLTTIKQQVDILDSMLNFNENIQNEYSKLIINYKDRNLSSNNL